MISTAKSLTMHLVFVRIANELTAATEDDLRQYTRESMEANWTNSFSTFSFTTCRWPWPLEPLISQTRLRNWETLRQATCRILKRRTSRSFLRLASWTWLLQFSDMVDWQTLAWDSCLQRSCYDCSLMFESANFSKSTGMRQRAKVWLGGHGTINVFDDGGISLKKFGSHTMSNRLGDLLKILWPWSSGRLTIRPRGPTRAHGPGVHLLALQRVFTGRV